MRSRYWSFFSRSPTSPVNSRIRSASVDFPWSMWAMMLKLRILLRSVMRAFTPWRCVEMALYGIWPRESMPPRVPPPPTRAGAVSHSGRPIFKSGGIRRARSGRFSGKSPYAEVDGRTGRTYCPQASTFTIIHSKPRPRANARPVRSARAGRSRRAFSEDSEAPFQPARFRHGPAATGARPYFRHPLICRWPFIISITKDDE